jgi:hypothetical protein
VTTTVDGKNVLEQTIVADGSTQPLSEADCQGNQVSQWSRDGERLFTRVELSCAGRPTRVVSGITQLAKGQWVDAQATVIDGDHDVRIRRYRRTSDQFSGAAPVAGAPMSVEDVIEASGKVLSPALEAALVESGGRFSLDSRTLKHLADAGVSPNVIDLMVAQAYPDRFHVERPSAYPSNTAASGSYGGSYGGSASYSGNTTVILGSSAYPSPMYDPFWSNYYYYSPFAYPYYWGSSYYPYRSYGYGYRNYYNNYYYGNSGGSIYPGGGSGPRGTAQPGSPDYRGGDGQGGDGAMVKGRGYTRVRPSSETSGDGNSTGATAPRTAPSGRTPRSVTSGSDASGSGSSSSGSSGGDSSSSSGSSGGGSVGGGGGGGGRTAQPR